MMEKLRIKSKLLTRRVPIREMDAYQALPAASQERKAVCTNQNKERDFT
jgi:hypothetical protein